MVLATLVALVVWCGRFCCCWVSAGGFGGDALGPLIPLATADCAFIMTQYVDYVKCLKGEEETKDVLRK